jgi:pre-mRNA-processing factor 6
MMKGCELCPSNEDVWLEAARLQVGGQRPNQPSRGGSMLQLILAVCCCLSSLSYCTAASPLAPPLSHTPFALPPIVQTPENAKAILARGVAALPDSVKLWMQAARLEQSDEAKKRVLLR